MEYAYSIARLETLHVDEFLELDGDSGYLIGRNLIVCDECRRNVFLNRGDKIKPYFSHYKESDITKKVCTKRVKGYSKHYVRQLNKRRSKLKIGYFQQRFEDLIFLTLIEMFEKNNKYFIMYGKNRTEPHEDGIAVLPINNETKLSLLDHLREVLASSLQNKRSIEMVEMLANLSKGWAGDEETFKTLFFKSRKLIKDDIFWSKYDFNYSDDNYKFAYETWKHLQTKNAKPLFHGLYIASLYFTLAVQFISFYEANTDDLDERLKLLAENRKSDFLNISWIEGFMEDQKIYPKDRSLFLATIVMIDAIQNKRFKLENQNLKFEELFNKFLESKTALDFTSNGKTETKMVPNTSKEWYLDFIESDPKENAKFQSLFEILGNSLRIFSICDLASVARRNYGDNMQSPDELLLNATAKNRGFIYIAWTPFGKTMWEKQLKEKAFSDTVKIGKSDDPERRKKEIAGNFAPPDSIEIIDYYPVIDMTKAENFVHNKLKKYRLSSNREVFGLDKDNANNLVNNIMENFYKK